MGHGLVKVPYASLNARQQENYNYQKAAGVLADYGYCTFRMSDDWNGADFIAVHIDDQKPVLRVQLKGRLEIAKKYIGRGLHICFHAPTGTYLYDHDNMVAVLLACTNVSNTASWKKSNGGYSYSGMNAKFAAAMDPFRIG